HDARRHVVDDDVDEGHERLDQLHTCRLLEVHGEAALPCVRVQEELRHTVAGIQEEVPGESIAMPDSVCCLPPPARPLDVDDVGPEITEDAGTERTDCGNGEVEDDDPTEQISTGRLHADQSPGG